MLIGHQQRLVKCPRVGGGLHTMLLNICLALPLPLWDANVDANR